jgi:methionyl-tRNA formyltransferase
MMKQQKNSILPTETKQSLFSLTGNIDAKTMHETFLPCKKHHQQQQQQQYHRYDHFVEKKQHITYPRSDRSIHINIYIYMTVSNLLNFSFIQEQSRNKIISSKIFLCLIPL